MKVNLQHIALAPALGLFVIIYSYLITLRPIEYDTKNYLIFYENLIKGDFSYGACSGFEPIFCFFSYFASLLHLSPFQIHYVWGLSTILLIVNAILKTEDPYLPKKLILIVTLSINFFNPSEIFFLTRQFVAGALLLNFFVEKNYRHQFVWGGLSFLTHFFVLPFLILFYLSHRKLRLIYVVKLLIFLCFSYVFLDQIFPSELNYIRATMEYKFFAYQGKNDGDVLLKDEVKFLVYFAISFYLSDRKTRKFLLLCFFFYLVTFVNPLMHLRYHKYFYFVFMFSFSNLVKLMWHKFISILSIIFIYRFISISRWLVLLI